MQCSPFKSYDFYEPRTTGRFSENPTRFGSWLAISSNYNNKFAFDINPSIAILSESGRKSFGINFSPRYRFNDHLALYYNFEFMAFIISFPLHQIQL